MQRLISFLALLPCPAFIVSRSGRLLFLNQRAEEHWFITRQFATGRRLTDLAALCEKGSRRIAQELQAMNAADRYARVIVDINDTPHTSALLIPLDTPEGMQVVAGILVSM